MISPNIIAKLIDDIKQKTTPNEGGFDFLTGGGVAPNIPAQQLGPVLSPDDFGSYVIPASDPTYSSGFDYARSIAGGIPMSQVIAPGVSYSPEQPMGYTQEQLNTAVGTTPVEPPQKLPGPGEEGYGQGIGGLTIFDEIFDIKRRPPRDLTPGTRSMFGGDPRDLPIPLSSLPRFNQAEMTKNIARTMRESGMDFTNLFGVPSVKPPSLESTISPLRSGPVIKPGPKPILKPVEELIAEGFIPPQEPISVGGIKDLILPPIASIENIAQDKRMANIPTSTPPIMPPMDMPPMNVPPMNVPPVNLPSMVELPPIGGIGKPNQNRFSIQQLPMGLF